RHEDGFTHPSAPLHNEGGPRTADSARRNGGCASPSGEPFMAAAFSVGQGVTVPVGGSGCAARGNLPRFARIFAPFLVPLLFAVRAGAEAPVSRPDARARDRHV